jgi:SAM-dependent methyltransferase
VLDIGCGGGDLGEALKMKINCKVTGLTFSEDEANLAQSRLDRVEVVDLNCLSIINLDRYDCIICSHVLEHLYEPESLLCALLDHCLIPDGLLVVALPNVLHWKQRLEFLLGRFRYTSGGIMDSTHYRFYDWNSASQLVSNAGYKILSRKSDGIFPLSRLLGPLRQVVDNAALTIFPGMFGNQFIIIAKG